LQFDYRQLQCKLPTEEIMDAQNFNFVPKFPQNEGFAVSHFVFLVCPVTFSVDHLGAVPVYYVFGST